MSFEGVLEDVKASVAAYAGRNKALGLDQGHLANATFDGQSSGRVRGVYVHGWAAFIES